MPCFSLCVCNFRIACDLLETEADGPGACISKPGCVAEMRNAGQNVRVCDGEEEYPFNGLLTLQSMLF